MRAAPAFSGFNVTWSGFRDLEYSVVAYEAAVGLCDEWNDTARVPLLDMGAATSHFFGRTSNADGSSCTWESVTTSTLCRLPQGAKYCAVVRALNEHGLWGERKRSSYVRVCRQPPHPGRVWDGISAAGDEVDYVDASQSSITLHWQGAQCLLPPPMATSADTSCVSPPRPWSVDAY